MYDIALLIDMTHHLTDEQCIALFSVLSQHIYQGVIICDPLQQENKWNLIGRIIVALDRGCYIRKKSKLLTLINEVLEVKEVIGTKIMGVEGVAIFAFPKKNAAKAIDNLSLNMRPEGCLGS